MMGDGVRIVTMEEIDVLRLHVGLSEKVRGEPMVVRYGDAKVERGDSGVVTWSFGYYSEGQLRARREWGKRFGE